MFGDFVMYGNIMYGNAVMEGRPLMAELLVWLTDQVDKRSSLGKKSRTRHPINRIPDFEAPQNEPDNGGSEQSGAGGR